MKENIDKKEKELKKEKAIKKKIDETEENIREVVVERKSGFNYAEVIVIMIITLILGFVIGSFITYIGRGNKGNSTIKKDIPDGLEEFVDTYENILSDYYQDIDKEKLMEAGIEGMLNFLGDDYSFYMNKEETTTFNEQVEGKYTGIGVEIVQKSDNSVLIARIFENSPAAKAGLKVLDRIVKINGVDVTDKTSVEISNIIRSTKGNIDMVVNRDGKDISLKLALSEVNIESVTSQIYEVNNKKIGYINISVFASNTYTQFEKKLLELEGKKINSLVIDVRDNSGGYLTSVSSIASLFIDKSKIIYKLDTKGIVEAIYSSSNSKRNYDIAILINKNSASASEILASALQESYGATVIGVNSYGKGTVQKAYQLESGATVKYTIQKWLTPKGNWINEIGVTPNIKEELSEEYYNNPSSDTDNQLQKALEELSK